MSDPLVSAQRLAEHLSDPQLRMLDATVQVQVIVRAELRLLIPSLLDDLLMAATGLVIMRSCRIALTATFAIP